MPRRSKSTVHSEDWQDFKKQDQQHKKKKNQARKDLQKQKLSDKRTFLS